MTARPRIGKAKALTSGVPILLSDILGDLPTPRDLDEDDEADEEEVVEVRDMEFKDK